MSVTNMTGQMASVSPEDSRYLLYSHSVASTRTAFLTRGALQSPRGYLAMFRDIFYGHKEVCYWQPACRGQRRCQAPHNAQESSSQESMLRPDARSTEAEEPCAGWRSPLCLRVHGQVFNVPSVLSLEMR